MLENRVAVRRVSDENDFMRCLLRGTADCRHLKLDDSVAITKSVVMPTIARASLAHGVTAIATTLCASNAHCVDLRRMS
jgi:hypothetical protein